ncbi:MAG: class I SAM-dependent methyltransferase [Chloroflexota bacterium]
MGGDQRFGDLVDQWDANAREDPLWVILVDPARAENRWTEAEFFATGVEEWARVSAWLADVGAAPKSDSRFVDFGCGVGRVTREMRAHLGEGRGVDISSEMVTQARRSDPDGTYVVNTAPNLAFIADGSVDLVYCHMVLQHLDETLQESLIGEFVRVLARDGVAVFQVANELAQRGAEGPALSRRATSALPGPAKRWIKRLVGRPVISRQIRIEMHLVPDARVRDAVDRASADVIAASYTNSTDPGHNGALRFFDRETAVARLSHERGASDILSQMYVVRRRAQPAGLSLSR